MAFSWYRMSIVLQSGGPEVFSGYFKVDDASYVITNFYNSNNLTTDILANGPGDHWGADFLYLNRFTESGTTIRSIPYLDATYSATEWAFWHQNGRTFLGYFAGGWFQFLPTSFVITQTPSSEPTANSESGSGAGATGATGESGSGATGGSGSGATGGSGSGATGESGSGATGGSGSGATGESGSGFGGSGSVISNTCFPAGTQVVTNQGKISIEKLQPHLHTIRNKAIVGITQTITPDKNLVCFEKDSLGPNIPSEKTIVSKNHGIFYKGKMMKAKSFVDEFENVYKVKYTGEVLYNVLMEEHDKMMVNNLICETLHPENSMAQIYKVLQKLSPKGQEELHRLKRKMRQNELNINCLTLYNENKVK